MCSLTHKAFLLLLGACRRAGARIVHATTGELVVETPHTDCKQAAVFVQRMCTDVKRRPLFALLDFGEAPRTMWTSLLWVDAANFAGESLSGESVSFLFGGRPARSTAKAHSDKGKGKGKGSRRGRGRGKSSHAKSDDASGTGGVIAVQRGMVDSEDEDEDVDVAIKLGSALGVDVDLLADGSDEDEDDAERKSRNSSDD